MEKERGQIKFIETDDGYRIEVKGKDLSKYLSCCCIPVAERGQAAKTDCCPPDEKKEC